ncbi:sarcosine oxidase [Fusarium tjaetaba]|uniref:Sarcosine oxidase n=1 Tax=Fusarium tjaetaba TaxID=1567544 RepID=A0A8H5R912_9HYPO|nr:sarcosine oxidase [Fusarium tjaetaba]KAF5628613.1 sarcosine oxidase [Fusarium tjaetaba]
MEQYDVAVAGLGALGSAAAYHASIKGARVVGFEQFELGHVHGASHDTSRIVRTSYGSPEFVALARSAYKDWAELERRSGMKMLTITGGVVFLPQKGPTPSSDFTTSLDANDVPHELLTPEETNKRWPGFNVPQGADTVFTPDSGIVHAAKAVMTLEFQARFNGAILRENTHVEAVTPQPSGGVAIETSQGVYHARKVIIAADAWTNKLLKPLGVELPITVMQEQVTYFKPSREHEAQFANDKFPAGQDAGINDMDPEERTWRPSERLSNKLNGFLDRLIPKRGDELRTVTCQYTITPDRQFIISELEKHKDVILALGNAHAFKFAPAIGRVTAELALDGKTTDDISKFGFPKTTPSKL